MKELHVLWLTLLAVIRAEDWQPISHPSVTYHGHFFKTDRAQSTNSIPKILNRNPSPNGFSSGSKLTALYRGPPSDGETCSVYKVSTNQELIYQYVEFQKDLPDLKEFTLCMWTKFHNHSDDHPLFSYSVPDSPKEILSWISNTAEASYFSLSIAGHTFFRLNYPLKLNTWYHSCQSWNGKTGEWQVWVNAERVGRGFHNRLVGHVIKGGGIAISGQDQSQLYIKDGIDQPNHQGVGLMGEITLLQLYRVALTAGKAHKDHKHHHVHHFKHDGTPIEPTQPPATEPPPSEATPIGNGVFLIGGQLTRGAHLNIAGQEPMNVPVQLPNGLQLQQQYINGQLTNRVVAEQLLSSIPLGKFPASTVQNRNQFPTDQTQILFPSVQSQRSFPSIQNQVAQFPSIQQSSKFPSLNSNQDKQFPQPSYLERQRSASSKPTTVILSSSLGNPANVQYIDDDDRHSIFRRNSVKRDKRDNPEDSDITNDENNKRKRGLVELSDGSIVDEALLKVNEDIDQMIFQQSIRNGLAGFDGNLPVQNIQKNQADEREPAEAEVKAVMDVCSGCAPEPFKKALILSWKTTPKKLYNGAHYYKGLPICKAF